LSRKVAGKEYPKYVITLPPRQVEELGWKEGEELEAKIKGNSVILRRASGSRLSTPKVS